MKTKEKKSLGRSYALGFWEKHCYAMDEMYELYEPAGQDNPPDGAVAQELVDLLQGDSRESIVRVFEAGEEDVGRFLEAAYQEIEAILGGGSSPFRLKRRKLRADDWAVSAALSPVSGVALQTGLGLTLRLDSGTLGRHYVFLTLWAVRGGRRVERVLSRCLADVTESAEYPTEGWDSGLVFLSRLKVADYMDSEDLSVDLDALVESLRSDLSKQDLARLRALAKSLGQAG